MMARTPAYLLVTHVPFGRGPRPGTLLGGDMWFEDLRAQVAALRGTAAITVAAPLHERLDPALSGSFNLAEITPAEAGIGFVGLPVFGTYAEFFRARSGLRAAIETAVAQADIVQADYGGHPVSIGQVVWPIAGAAHRKRIWLFDGADPFPRLQRTAQEDPNPLRRWVRGAIVKRFEGFCRRAVAEADLVFAHNHSVVARFRDVWSGRCHLFPRSFVREETLVSEADLERRTAALRAAARPLRLVVAGRQIAIKATDHVIKAVAEVRRGGAAVDLVVLGDGEDLPAFRRLAQDLGVSEAVNFAGQVPYGKPLFDVWASCDVMVITNLTAEISRNVLLAMARGLPVIMYSNPGTDELVEGADAAQLVPCGDVPALTQAIAQANADRGRLAQLATNAHALARRTTLEGCHRERARLIAACLAGAAARA